ncbi:hypothetical protein ABFS83_08G021800 [Erythranthe nasuta]
MASETADPVNVSTRKCHSSSKKNSAKIPRKIHKAEREKLKRDRMNELFLDLGRTLDLDHPNSGKASILRETVRLIGELLTQVDNLKKENTTLSSESNYVTIEKNELLEETLTLDAQIKNLQREIEERADNNNCSNLDVNTQSQSNGTTHVPVEEHVSFPLVVHASESISAVGPVFVVPLHHESQLGLHNPFNIGVDMDMPKAHSNVSRPRARYPSSYDSWPSHILTTNQPNLIEDV